MNQIYDSARRGNPLLEEVRMLVKYRELLAQFVARAIKTRYKRSVLGVLWTMLNPLLTMIVLSVVFSNYLRSTLENYPVYVLCGLMAWNFFSSTTQAAMGEMLWSGALIQRIYVPKSVFAVAALGTGLVNIGLSLGPLLIITLALGVPLRPALLVLPLSVLLLAIFALGVGLLLSTAVVYFADMMPVYEVLLTIWLYATPIIYPLEIIPKELRGIFQFNPMFYFVELFRLPIHSGVVPPLQTWLIGAAIAVTTLVVGGWVFTSHSNDYAYRI
jgi:ABC-type polysaccharide/polyol phosphate export permease